MAPGSVAVQFGIVPFARCEFWEPIEQGENDTSRGSNVSVNSKPDHPPRATPGDSHIPVAPGVGFSPLSLARGGS